MDNYEKNLLDYVVYQIYPRSFCDSNGDGVGDINGIIQKLDYLAELGVNTLWISPFFKSPQCDNGYDISDYRDIDPMFGTISDFDNLIATAHKKSIKIVMDLVANHTSSEHYWFKEARKSKDNPYHDYYYWAEKPLTDWTACFGGSAWEYNKATNEYYLHSFAIGQPDVNWNNPKVRKEYCDIVDFWADKGVDGFRCDVLDFISKDFENNKMNNGPMLHSYIKELFGREKVKKLFTVGECQSDEKSISDICGKDRNELKCVFQFEHFGVGRSDKYTPIQHSCKDVKNILSKWQSFIEKNNLIYTLLTDNHDQPWYNSRVGNDGEYRYESATMFAAMFYLSKGIPFIYQGQEMGSANSYFNDIKYFSDIETVNYYHDNENKIAHEELVEKINYGSRDNTRRPFAWDNNENHGFTSAKHPWLPYATRSNEINADNDLNGEKSIIKFYREVLRLRKENETLRYGISLDLSCGKDYYAYIREYQGQKILVVCNFENEVEISGLPISKEQLLFNYESNNEPNHKYKPFECNVYRL